jgi:hypothetical protein
LAPRRTGREAGPRFTARGRLRRLVSRMSEPSLPLTARGRSGDTRSRLAAGSGWRKPQDPTRCSRQVWGMGPITARGRIEPKHCGTPGHTAGRRAHRAENMRIQRLTSKQQPKTPSHHKLRQEVLPSISGGRYYILLSGIMCYGSWASRESHDPTSWRRGPCSRGTGE